MIASNCVNLKPNWVSGESKDKCDLKSDGTGWGTEPTVSIAVHSKNHNYGEHTANWAVSINASAPGNINNPSICIEMNIAEFIAAIKKLDLDRIEREIEMDDKVREYCQQHFQYLPGGVTYQP